MKRTFFIIITIAVIGLVAYFLFFRSTKNSPEAGVSNAENMASQAGTIIPIDPANVPPGEKIAIGTQHGTVVVRNFYKVAEGFDGDALVIRATANYEILYDKIESAFGIFVMAGPVQSSARAAENDFISILGISREQACFLNAVWSVSAVLDKNLSGKDYPLSFCTDVSVF